MYESVSDIKDKKISNRSSNSLTINKILPYHGKHQSNNFQNNNYKDKLFSKSNIAN